MLLSVLAACLLVSQSSDELLEQAVTLRLRGDWNGAWRAFDQAVEADPESPSVRFQRGAFFSQVQSIVTGEQRELFVGLAVEDLAFVSRRQPGSRLAGVAIDTLDRLVDFDPFPEAPLACEGEGGKAFEEAEQLFLQGRYEDALWLHDRAAESCPGSARALRSRANDLQALDRNDEARSAFLRVLEVEPWDAVTHRILADALEPEAALHHAVRAVLSDPAYEGGWSSLAYVARLQGGRFLRVYGQLPRIAVTGRDEETGAPLHEMVLYRAGGYLGSEGEDPDFPCWAVYGTRYVARLVEEEPMDPWSRTLATVRETLAYLKDPGDSAPVAPGPFWSQLARSEAAGYLEEAVLLHLPSAELADVLRERRESGVERLERYLLDVVAPGPWSEGTWSERTKGR